MEVIFSLNETMYTSMEPFLILVTINEWLPAHNNKIIIIKIKLHGCFNQRILKPEIPQGMIKYQLKSKK